MKRLLIQWLGLCALLLATACGTEHPAPPADGGPALWRIQGPNIDGWLFGTIHILPQGVEWRTAAIRNAINGSDRLVLEAAEIQDRAATQALFETMGRSANLPPLEKRLPSQDKNALQEALDESGTSSEALSGYESWAAALLLSAGVQQAAHIGQGVEPALIETFQSSGKSIGGLETVRRQFSAFDTLPEVDQRRLLFQTVRDAKDVETLYDRALKAWIRGDVAAISREGRIDPIVEQAVLIARNRDWVKSVERLKGRPFIAVGAAHLAGQDNLIQLLQAKGYRVTRVH